MDYIPNEFIEEPAMRFEGIVRYTFDCERGEGPNNIADASVFDREFIPNITKNGLLILNEILDALIEKSNLQIQKELQGLKKSLTSSIEQQNAIELVDYIIVLIKENLAHSNNT